MSQDTTQEFAARLRQALDVHPRAPENNHGRLTWLRKEVENKGFKVSLNAIHKWYHGTSRPREDKVRMLASVLAVDELWLAMGRTPVDPDPDKMSPHDKFPGVPRVSGAVLLVAGLIEVSGGRVLFPEETATGVPHLSANLNGKQFDVIAVAPQAETNHTLSFIIPEPTNGSRVLGVIPGTFPAVTLLDITEAERTNLGGFSVVQVARDATGAYHFPGTGEALMPVSSADEIAV